MKFDRIAPTCFDLDSNKIFLGILVKSMKNSTVSQRVPQIPLCSVMFAMNTLNNEQSYDVDTRLYATSFIRIISVLKNSTRLTPTEENKIRNENEMIESNLAISIFMKNIIYEIEFMESNPVNVRLIKELLKIFYGWLVGTAVSDDSDRVDYRSAIKFEMDFLKHIFGITKSGACDSVTQQLAIGLPRNFCSLATLYGDYQTILRDQTESRELRTFHHEEIQSVA